MFARLSGKCNNCSVLDFMVYIFWVWQFKKKERRNLFNNWGKRSDCGCTIERMFEIHGDLRILFSIEATAKGSMKNLDFVSIDEKQVTGRYCLLGTSIWIATVYVFDMSCWSSLQTLNTWVISLYVAILSTEVEAPLSSRKAISRLETVKLKVSFWVWIHRN